MEKKIPTEAEEQKALCKWLREHNIKHFSTAMGVWFGKTNYRYIMSLKSRGFEAGVPDLVLLFDNGVTAFIELKRREKSASNVRPCQEEWIKWLLEHGYPAKICYGAEEAVLFVKSIIGEK